MTKEYSLTIRDDSATLLHAMIKYNVNVVKYISVVFLKKMTG